MDTLIPEGLFYTKDHEWARVEDGKARVGITDYAQHELGDIVYVELKPAGTTVKTGDALGTVESVKAVSEVYSPVGGVVAEVNVELDGSPELVNQDCYGKGWMVVIAFEGAGPSKTAGIMDAAAYKEYLAKEAK
ncbi:MAG TPA: glycine cleavage system protein GcvH [Deltaproteobacteria bacterium]|nr:glycine cleavage system protein GcvH [Deltaproteobacteria bacterium]HOM30328.1 glycine cleavage system protein GcvH [Deltaproteobacteria bacterium]